MNSKKVFTLKELAELLQGELAGPADLEIHGVGDLTQAGEDEISFITEKKYLPMLAQTRALAIVTKPAIKVDKPAIILERPILAFAKLLDLFAPTMRHPEKGAHPTAVVESPLDESVAVGANAYIGPNTTIGENTIIYPNVYIGSEVRIGSDCLIWPGVVIRERVVIGDRVIIHPNTVIGADGFGYNFINGRHRKVTHIGTVVVEDDVEIGACACIDRAKAGATQIGVGAKIDNLVQIGHNVKVGPHAILAGQAGLGGSTNLGAYAMLGGQAGAVDNLNIGDRVRVTAHACVMSDIEPDLIVSGVPAKPNQRFLREVIALQRLPEALKTITELTKRVNELEQAMHNSQRSGD
jgi:UDP-3-O-[3-hydroxymyristoyl] glucosamine N-acyltransferase